MKPTVFFSLILLSGCTSSQVSSFEILSHEVSDNRYTLIAISDKESVISNSEVDSVFKNKASELCPHGYLFSESAKAKGSNDAWKKRSMEQYIKTHKVKGAHSYFKDIICTI